MVASFMGVMLIVVYSSKNNLALNDDFNHQQFLWALGLNVLSAILASLVNIVLRLQREIHSVIGSGF